MINARSETITEKPSLRQAVKYSRYLIPTSGFYEWKHEGKLKLPHYLRIKGDEPMLFACGRSRRWSTAPRKTWCS